MGLAPVFLGAEDHPPRDRRPKCLTGSAITLVRLARPNPRGRHARVADPSGVECQRDGSDQGQRMEAGDGALTPDRCPAPSRDANRSPAVPPLWSQGIVLFQTGVSRIPMPPMNTRRAPAPDPTSGVRPRRAEPHPLQPPFGLTGVRKRDRCPHRGDCDPQAPIWTIRALSGLGRDGLWPELPEIRPSRARCGVDATLAEPQHYRACEM